MPSNELNNQVIKPIVVNLLAIGLILFSVFLIYSAYVFLPDNGEARVHWFGCNFDLHKEARIAMLVILAGAMGSTVHVISSFTKYIGYGKLYKRWIWWYMLRPFAGSSLALVCYFVIRGGLFTNTISDEINVYGILAISGMVGMFSKQATDKLNEVFNNLFRTENKENSENSITEDDLKNNKNFPL